MRDETYESVKKLVAKSKYAPSVSGLQRLFQIGYNRAASYIELLIADGLIERDSTDKWKLHKL